MIKYSNFLSSYTRITFLKGLYSLEIFINDCFIMVSYSSSHFIYRVRLCSAGKLTEGLVLLHLASNLSN
jgi:hypothetical protein